jgi:flagellar L-ring protein precursor FlgH
LKNRTIPAVTALALALTALPSPGENLYSEKTFRALASDKRAHLAGDALTILIYENSSASTSADTVLQRSNEVGIKASGNHRSQNLDVAVSNNFDGGGTVQRAGRLLAQMTVTVTGTTANGDLLIAGQQQLEINADRQTIRVEGRVRPLDISEANTVLSYRIADARISYLGDGDLAARQRPGFWSRLFVWAGF